MTLTPSKREIVRRLLDILIFDAVIIGIYYIVHFDIKYIFGFIIVYIIFGLPCTYLFLEYFWHTRKLKSVIVTEDEIITYYTSDKIQTYNLKDLNILKLYKSAGMDKGSFATTLNEKYYYARIVAKDGTKIILTSFLGRDLDVAIELICNKAIVDRLKTKYAYINFY